MHDGQRAGETRDRAHADGVGAEIRTDGTLLDGMQRRGRGAGAQQRRQRCRFLDGKVAADLAGAAGDPVPGYRRWAALRSRHDGERFVHERARDRRSAWPRRWQSGTSRRLAGALVRSSSGIGQPFARQHRLRSTAIGGAPCRPAARRNRRQSAVGRRRQHAMEGEPGRAFTISLTCFGSYARKLHQDAIRPEPLDGWLGDASSSIRRRTISRLWSTTAARRAVCGFGRLQRAVPSDDAFRSGPAAMTSMPTARRWISGCAGRARFLRVVPDRSRTTTPPDVFVTVTSENRRAERRARAVCELSI